MVSPGKSFPSGSLWIGMGLAIVLVLAATVASASIPALVVTPLAPFLVAVALSAWAGGTRPALIALLGSLLPIHFVALTPRSAAASSPEAAAYVAAADAHTAATITAHHLLFNRNALFTGGLRPHYYCLPVLKREEHRRALVAAATSGSPKFFLGTDSAPHAAVLKEHALGCAGCYTALSALELYATAFEAAGALDKLEGFASFHGADFYGLPRNTGRVTLRRQAWALPETVPFGAQALKPLCGGETLHWQLAAVGAPR